MFWAIFEVLFENFQMLFQVQCGHQSARTVEVEVFSYWKTCGGK